MELLVFCVPPVLAGVAGYLVNRWWLAALPAAVVAFMLWRQEAIIEGMRPSYCRGQTDCPDPDLTAVAFGIYALVVAVSVLASLGGVLLRRRLELERAAAV